MKILVVNGGPPPLVAPRDRYDLVIAADSGLDHAARLGLAVDVIVGDLDSVSSEALAAARAAGIPVEQHPAAKDATDLELALVTAVDRGADAITVLSGDGGRLDHLLTGLAQLADDAYTGVRVEAYCGRAHIVVVRAGEQACLSGPPGELVTIWPVGGAAVVSLNGLVYPLEHFTLSATTTRGVSNEIGANGRGIVDVHDGVVLAIRPESATLGTTPVT